MLKINAKRIFAATAALIMAAGTQLTAMAAGIQLPSSANAAASSASATSSLTINSQSPSTDLRYADVSAITVIDRDLHAGYRITNQNDMVAILTALNAIECRYDVNVKEDMQNLKLLRILMKDGTAHNFWCHTNVLMLEDKHIATAAQAKTLYDVMERCKQNYTACPEWLGYMNPFRVTSMQLDAINSNFKTYQSAVSESQRQTILTMLGRLASVNVGLVRKIGGNAAQTYGDGRLLYKITLDFENGKEGYNIYLFDDKRINISVDSIGYDLSYQSSNNATWNALVTSIQEYVK